MGRPPRQRTAGRLRDRASLLTTPESTPRKKTPEQQFFDERFGAYQAYEALRRDVVKLRTVPNPNGNEHLRKRNEMLKTFKNRAWAGQTVLMRKMNTAFERSDELLAEYNNAQKIRMGTQEREELNSKDIVNIVRRASKRTRDEIINPAVEPVLLEKMRAQALPLARIKRDCDRMRVEIEQESAWQNDDREFQRLQNLDEDFPKGYGLSEIFQMEDQVLPQQPAALNEKKFPNELIEAGKGAFGKVYKTRNARGELVALKRYLPGREDQATHEYDLFRKSRGKIDTHLVLPKAVHRVDTAAAARHPELKEGQLLVEYPFISGKNTIEYLNDIAVVEPDTKARETHREAVLEYSPVIKQLERQEASLRILLQISKALQSMHSQGLIHQDAKPENIIIDERGEARLFDMGEVIRQGEQAEKLAGSPRYMPAKALSIDGYKGSPDIDVYALGVMSYVLLTGDEDPFQDKVLLKTLKGEGLERGQLKKEFFIELGQKKEILEDKASVRIPERDPFHEQNIKRRVFKATPEMIQLIRQATGSSITHRMKSVDEFLNMTELALSGVQNRLSDINKKQERSKKIGTDRFFRKAAEKEAEKRRQEERELAMREAERAKQEEEKEKRKTQLKDTFLGVNQTRVDAPATKEKPKKEKKKRSPEEIEARKRRNRTRATQFYGK